MRKYNTILFSITLALAGMTPLVSSAQGVKNALILQLGYFNDNNQVQFLKASTKTKIDRKFQPVQGANLRFYITEETPGNLLGKAVSNEKGEAVLYIPPSAGAEWNKSPKPHFIVVTEPSKLYDSTNSSLDIVKARLKLDTAADRKIVVHVMALNDSGWVPVKGVDIKVAVKRLDGDLNVGDAPTYSSDSLGVIAADFKRDSLPGDAKGNLIFIAKVEDNDTYGNVTVERTIPWGAPTKLVSHFDQRTLFARRGRSPLWLELMAYAIIAGVWSVLFYLFGQIRKLKRL